MNQHDKMTSVAYSKQQVMQLRARRLDQQAHLLSLKKSNCFAIERERVDSLIDIEERLIVSTNGSVLVIDG